MSTQSLSFYTNIAIPNGKSFKVPYPTGYSQSSYNSSVAGFYAVINGVRYNSGSGLIFALASDGIAVTNNTGADIPGQTFIAIYSRVTIVGDNSNPGGILARIINALSKGSLPILMPSGAPTVGAATTATSIATGTTRDVFTDPTIIPYTFTLLRAKWALGSGFPNSNFMVPLGATLSAETGTINAPNGGSCPLVAFWSDAPKLEILTKYSSGGYRIKVDGQYAATGTKGRNSPSFGTNGEIYIPIDWTGVRKLRLYELECDPNVYFMGVRTDKISTVFKSDGFDDNIRHMVITDSYGDDPNVLTTDLQPGFAGILANISGIRNTLVSSSGATGYISTASGTRYNAIQRLIDVQNFMPHKVTVALGVNDTQQAIYVNQANMTQKVNDYFDALQAIVPNALITVIGPWAKTTAAPGSDLDIVRNGIKAACGRSNMRFIDSVAHNWFTGNASKSAPLGNGNSDIMIGNAGGSDTFHPSSPDGVIYLAQRVNHLLGSSLASFAAP